MSGGRWLPLSAALAVRLVGYKSRWWPQGFATGARGGGAMARGVSSCTFSGFSSTVLARPRARRTPQKCAAHAQRRWAAKLFSLRAEFGKAYGDTFAGFRPSSHFARAQNSLRRRLTGVQTGREWSRRFWRAAGAADFAFLAPAASGRRGRHPTKPRAPQPVNPPTRASIVPPGHIGRGLAMDRWAEVTPRRRGSNTRGFSALPLATAHAPL